MTCPDCNGRGWVIREAKGVSSAGPCACRRPVYAQREEAERKPTDAEFTAAALYLARVIDFGPRDDELMVELLASEMKEYVSTKAQLDQFLPAAKNAIKAWSYREFRALFCQMFEPKDKRYIDDPNAGEMRSIEAEGRKFFEEIGVLKRKRLAAPPQQSVPAPALEEPPRLKMEDRGRLVMDQDAAGGYGNFRQESDEERKARIKAEVAAAEEQLKTIAQNRRSDEENARRTAELEAQLKARMEKKQ